MNRQQRRKQPKPVTKHSKALDQIPADKWFDMLKEDPEQAKKVIENALGYAFSIEVAKTLSKKGAKHAGKISHDDDDADD